MTQENTDWRHARTDRLRLEMPTAADIEDLHAIHADPATWSHLPSGRYTDREQTVRMVQDGLTHWAETGLGYWSIRGSPDGPVIGRGGCAVLPGEAWWNLYYRFSPSVQGRGYATEMALAAITAAHDVDPERPVLAYLLEHNVGSRRTAERAGLRQIWRGPDAGNPDPEAVRLVFLDREPDAELLRRLGTSG